MKWALFVLELTILLFTSSDTPFFTIWFLSQHDVIFLLTKSLLLPISFHSKNTLELWNCLFTLQPSLRKLQEQICGAELSTPAPAPHLLKEKSRVALIVPRQHIAVTVPLPEKSGACYCSEAKNLLGACAEIQGPSFCWHLCRNTGSKHLAL